MSMSSKVVLFVVVTIHCHVFGCTLDAKTLFMSMAMLNNVQYTMTQLIPRVVSLGGESLVSLRRIGDFLLTKEFSPSDKLEVGPIHREVIRSGSSDDHHAKGSSGRYHGDAGLTTFQSIGKVQLVYEGEDRYCGGNVARDEGDNNKLKPQLSTTEQGGGAVFIECRNVGSRWPQAEVQTLDKISFRCQAPSLNVVCGQVASGKSSLLLSLLNELPISEGEAKIHGSYSYCSQTPWIFNGTVRDNIVFGHGFNEQRFKEIVEICALKRDLELLEFGDLTYIQEDSLSGGQKARVNLARCLYRDSDIYLLDDPFSAIDGKVAEHIFAQAIERFLSNKLIILATHKVSFLKQSGRVLLLDQGKQLAFCSYSELKYRLLNGRDDEHFTRDQLKRLSFLTDALARDDSKGGDIELGDAKHLRNNGGDENGGKYEDIGGAKMPLDLHADQQKHVKSSELSSEAENLSARNSAALGAHIADSFAFAGSNGETRTPKCSEPLAEQPVESRQVADGSAKLEESQKYFNDGQNKPKQTVASATDINIQGSSGHGTVHAPYGSANLLADADKSLITNSTEEATTRRHLAMAKCATRPLVSGTDSPSPLETMAEEDIRGEGSFGSGEKSANKVVNNDLDSLARASNHDGPTATNATVSISSGDYRPTSTSDDLPAPQHTCLTSTPTQMEGDKISNRTSGTDICHKQTPHRAGGVTEISKGGGGGKQGEDNLRSRNGPADEEMSSRKLPGLSVWYKYYTQTSVIRLVLLVLTFLITQALFSTVDIYLTVWSLIEQNKALLTEITSANQQQLVLFEHEAYINQEPVDRSNISRSISYDSLPADVTSEHRAGEPPLLMLSPSSPFVKYNCTSQRLMAVREGSEMVGEIQQVGISPLSHRSSRQIEPPLYTSGQQSLLLLIPKNKVRVPLVSLFYVAKATLPRHKSSWGITGRSDDVGADYKLAEVGDGNGVSHIGGPRNNRARDYDDEADQRLDERLQLEVNQITIPSPSETTYAAGTSTTTTATTSSLPYGDNDIAPGESSDSEVSGVVLIDRDIFEESEQAFNVKSIYRPLYLLVNKLTSGQHVITYILLLIAVFLSSATTNVLSLTTSNKSAISLDKKLTDSALFARIAFFDLTPVGRFLNRATRDIGIIDEAIPYTANQAYTALLQTAATFIVVMAVDITMALPSAIILTLFLIFHSVYVGPVRDIQRYEGIARSPIISHVSTTLAGLYTIRAAKSEHRFQQLFMRHQDAHTAVFILYLGCNRVTAVVLDWLNASYTGIIVLWVIISGMTGPTAGLIITTSLMLSGITQHGVMKLAETESLMTSVERVIEYCSLPQEESSCRRDSAGREKGSLSTTANGGVEPPSYRQTARNSIWPSRGYIEYTHVDLYYNRSDKPVLKNISFKVEAGEKIGIIGRTGAGKSSIITTLFRLYDFDGSILIDGIDIKQIGLLKLRTAIGIIPQTPVLFSTTIRKNLDPLDVYDDFSIWNALAKAHLRETVSALPGKLEFNIGNVGFSSGQKQLMCLARVLLRRNSIIVLDEATANVDPNTDAIIQATIRSEFSHCTVLTIAHRLETILDCNRIMVLDAGRIVDFDTPERLLGKGNSHFVGLMRDGVNFGQ